MSWLRHCPWMNSVPMLILLKTSVATTNLSYHILFWSLFSVLPGYISIHLDSLSHPFHPFLKYVLCKYTITVISGLNVQKGNLGLFQGRLHIAGSKGVYKLGTHRSTHLQAQYWFLRCHAYSCSAICAIWIPPVYLWRTLTYHCTLSSINKYIFVHRDYTVVSYEL